MTSLISHTAQKRKNKEKPKQKKKNKKRVAQKKRCRCWRRRNQHYRLYDCSLTSFCRLYCFIHKLFELRQMACALITISAIDVFILLLWQLIKMSKRQVFLRQRVGTCVGGMQVTDRDKTHRTTCSLARSLAHRPTLSCIPGHFKSNRGRRRPAALISSLSCGWWRDRAAVQLSTDPPRW